MVLTRKQAQPSLFLGWLINIISDSLVLALSPRLLLALSAPFRHSFRPGCVGPLRSAPLRSKRLHISSYTHFVAFVALSARIYWIRSYFVGSLLAYKVDESNQQAYCLDFLLFLGHSHWDSWILFWWSFGSFHLFHRV